MSSFIMNVDRYIRIPFKANVLLVHHSGHTTGRARGSSALKAALDAEYMVEKDENFVTITPTKMKDSELPPSLTLQFKKVELGEFNGEVMHSAMLTSSADSTQMRVGKRLDGRSIYVVDVLNYISRGWKSQEDAMRYLECSKKTVIDALGKLITRDLVVQNILGNYENTPQGNALLSTTGINLVPQTNYYMKGCLD
jgi:hypothetical protein